MTSQSDHVEIVYEEVARGAALDRSPQRSVHRALGRVWMLAGTIFLTSSLFFYFMTGVAKLIFPLALLAFGLGVIGSVQVIAKIDIARRRND